MNRLAIILIGLFSLSANAQDMRNYLSETQNMVKERKYDEALKRFIWYHEHVLEYDRAQYGVRLSFALSYWKSLADIYPPALTAFIEMRDQKTKQITENGGTPELFHDVAALNRTLGEDIKTIELFQKLTKDYPKMAEKCWPAVKDQLLAAKKYDLLRNYLVDPVREFYDVKELYIHVTSTINKFKDDEATIKARKIFYDNNFVEGSLKLVNYSLAIGDLKSAKEIQNQALNVLDDERLKHAIPDNIK